ncbi:MAG TPA: cytochrome b/b6 domain-containing protein [Chitinophagaceae bacterium]
MTVIKTQASLFLQSKPASIRLWHWLIFLFFSFSIICVILGSTIFKTNYNISMVQDQVKEKGGSLTKEQAWNVAHEYSDKLWILHTWFGYGLCILLFWRILIEWRLSKEKNLRTRIKMAMGYPKSNNEKKHYLFVQYSYSLFYLLFILMALTGLILAFEDIEWLKPFHRTANSIHSVVQYGIYAFIILHIVGVMRADLGKYNGVISRMIHGKA